MDEIAIAIGKLVYVIWIGLIVSWAKTVIGGFAVFIKEMTK